MVIDPQVQILTWAASVICAIAVTIECLRTWIGIHRNSTRCGSKAPASFLLESRWFLPFYFAGITQWLIFGLRSQNLALSIPCFIQMIFMAPLIFHWGQQRMRE